jgi:hypothetical protein
MTRAIRREVEPRQGYVHTEQVSDLSIHDLMMVTIPDGPRRFRNLNTEDMFKGLDPK